MHIFLLILFLLCSYFLVHSLFGSFHRCSNIEQLLWFSATGREWQQWIRMKMRFWWKSVRNDFYRLSFQCKLWFSNRHTKCINNLRLCLQQDESEKKRNTRFQHNRWCVHLLVFIANGSGNCVGFSFFFHCIFQRAIIFGAMQNYSLTLCFVSFFFGIFFFYSFVSYFIFSYMKKIKPIQHTLT